MKDSMKKTLMNVTVLFSKESKAKKKKVGCILFKDDRILSIGYNGTPSGWDNRCEKIINYNNLEYETFPEVIHAEANCLAKVAKSTESSEDSYMFVTLSPCLECAKSIYIAGIKKVFYLEKYRCTTGLDFLKKCNIETEQVDINND